MLVQKKTIFLEKVLPPAAKLPGTSGFFHKMIFWTKTSAPDSEAARDKWLLQKDDFVEKDLPQAAKLPGTSGYFKKKSIFLPKVLPQAAKLRGTSGFFKKKTAF